MSNQAACKIFNFYIQFQKVRENFLQKTHGRNWESRILFPIKSASKIKSCKKNFGNKRTQGILFLKIFPEEHAETCTLINPNIFEETG